MALPTLAGGNWCAGLFAAAMIVAPTATQAAGALAVGSCDRYGYTFNYGSVPAAQLDAVRSCASEGDGSCQVVITVERSCYAFAVDEDDHCAAKGWAYAPNLAQARGMAVGTCTRYGGRDCVVRLSICDGG